MKGTKTATTMAMVLMIAALLGGTALAAPELHYKAGPLHSLAEVDEVLKKNKIWLETADGNQIKTEDELRLFLQGVGVSTGKAMYLLLSPDEKMWRITNTPPAGTETTPDETKRRPGFSVIELKNSHRFRVPTTAIKGTSAEAALNRILVAEKRKENLLSIEMKGDYGIANITYLTASGEDLQKLTALLKQQIQENGELRKDCEVLLKIIESHLKKEAPRLQEELSEFKSNEKIKKAFEEYLKDHPRDVELIGLVKELAQALEASPFQRVGPSTVVVGSTQSGLKNNQIMGNNNHQESNTIEGRTTYGDDLSFNVNNLTLGDGGSGGKTLTIKRTVTRVQSLNLPQRARPVAIYHLPPEYRR